MEGIDAVLLSLPRVEKRVAASYVRDLDVSSLTKYILREDDWEKVRVYLLNEPYYLTLTLAEISNAIWKHCMLYKKVSHKKAKTMFDVVICNL